MAMKHFREFLLLLCLAAILPGRALSAQETAEKPVSFCFNEWPPYARMIDNRASGISVDIIREAARKLDKPVDFVDLPWKRCLQMVLDGRIDAVIDAAKREQYVQGPTSFSIYSDTFWVHEDSKATTHEELRGGTIGLISGYKYVPELLTLIEKLDLKTEHAVDDPTNIRKLAFRRVDTIIGDSVSTLHFAREHKLHLRPILPSYSVDPLYVSFNTGKAALQRQFDATFEELLRSGFVDRIYDGYVNRKFRDLAAGSSIAQP